MVSFMERWEGVGVCGLHWTEEVEVGSSSSMRTGQVSGWAASVHRCPGSVDRELLGEQAWCS